ncbi:unnamed protein product [Parnassius apollo]|uniref:(apollo) hypothetical protein n=1 Tax=Parnassius apollo TaxID=110799 RepID=A0A8S3WB15_PARAO|nr:unnamed protein product [Parnassius apollo]
MYSGKQASTPETGSKTEKLVLKLMRSYPLRGHHLFMDNYYNSVSLSQKLLELRTHTTGTLRTNRKDNPKDIVKKTEERWKKCLDAIVDRRSGKSRTLNAHFMCQYVVRRLRLYPLCHNR